jgi:hypothetical protein
MFIVIYKEGSQHDTPLTRETYNLANAMPGEKYIFEWGGEGQDVYSLNVLNGLWYDAAWKKIYFQHGFYCLTAVNHINTFLIEFIFRYKDVEDIAIRIDTTNGGMPLGITNAVKEIMLASKFASWAEYQKHRASQNEIALLKKRVELLEKENEELKQKLNVKATTA